MFTSSSLLTQIDPQPGNKMNRIYTGIVLELWVFGTQRVMQMEAIPLRLAHNHRNLYAQRLRRAFDEG